MRLNQIHVFLAVVDAGSFRAAARALGVSPPAVTKSLRQLEEELRVSLLNRTQHGVVLTEAGRAFISRARAVRAELRKAEEDMARLSGAEGGSVTLGAGPTELALVVPDAIAELRKHHGRTSIRVLEGLRRTWLPLLREQTIDFGIGLRPNDKLEAGLSFKPLFRSDFVVAARKGHPLRHAGSLARLANAEWLTLAPRSSSAGLLDEAFAAAGVPPPPPATIHCESFGGIAAVVAKTDMLTLISRRVLGLAFARDLLQEIPVAERLPTVTHGLFLRTDAPLTRTAAAMAKAVTAVGRKLAQRG